MNRFISGKGYYKTGELSYKVNEGGIKFQYYKNGKIKSISRETKGKEHTEFYTEDGKLESEGYYINNQEHGPHKMYNSDEKLYLELVYDMGKFVLGYKYDKKGIKKKLTYRELVEMGYQYLLL